MDQSQLTKQLSDCYSAQAEHFTHTRKREWPELQHIKTYLRTLQITKERNSTILELGCGSGRLYPEIQEVFGKNFIYIGADLAPGMITKAHKTYKGKVKNDNEKKISVSPRIQTQRIIGDMLNTLCALPDNSIDCIISIASLQHLMTHEERQLLRAHSYRVLSYEGSFISTNWSYSKRFLKTYRTQQLQTLLKIITSLGKRQWNDLLIPRKDPQRQKNKQVRQRYYHLFTLYELRQLSTMSGFVIKKIGYILQDGNFDKKNRQESRNSLLIAKKDIHK